MNFNDYVQEGIKSFQENNLGKALGKALENLEAALNLQSDNKVTMKRDN